MRTNNMNERSSEVSLNAIPAVIGLIGFGEAGMAFAKGWQLERRVHSIIAYDQKTKVHGSVLSDDKWQDYTATGVSGCRNLAEALAPAQAVFSLVTADQAHIVARDAANVASPDTIFFDCNSCAPSAKRASAELIDAAGMRYVDVAVMSPVHPHLHKSPLLICGPYANDAAHLLASLGMSAEIVVGDIGRASSIKMMRSIMIKGLEALALECIVCARKAGVDKEVLASLDASFPGFGWPKRVAYMMERTTTHGVRRAAEMREVAKTVSDLGVANDMASAIVNWQQSMGDLRLDAGPDDYGVRTDAILAALETKDST